jgi:predicted nucleic acid-binding protein
VRGYLLDTNIVVYWFDARRPQHERVVRHIQELPEATPLMIADFRSAKSTHIPNGQPQHF